MINRFAEGIRCWAALGLLLGVFVYGALPTAFAQNSERVLQTFEAEAAKKAQISEQFRLTTKEKHTILFVMGIALLIGILTTAALGVAMGVYGKPVFVAHMVAAGLTVTLAIVHAIVAIVWFFPF